MDPDEPFVRRAQRGDRLAFEILVERHANKLYSLAARSLGSREDAEDAVQEAFIRAWRGLGSFRGGSRFSTWLYRICLNAVHDQRGRRAAPVAELDDDTAADPRDHFADQELGGDLQRALDALEEPYRTAIVLADLLGCSYAEVSAVTDTPVGTVKSRIFRGRTELAKLLGTAPAAPESKDR